MPRRRRAWDLDERAFEALLARLDPDAAVACEKYVMLHERLTMFFECSLAHGPEDLADATIDRVAAILAENNREIESVASFALGVARNILKESWRQDGREREAIQSLATPEPEEPLDGFGKPRELLEQAIARLPEQERELLESYCGSHDKIRVRKLLAQRLRISDAALKLRIHRIRAKLWRYYVRQSGWIRGGK